MTLIDKSAHSTTNAMTATPMTMMNADTMTSLLVSPTFAPAPLAVVSGRPTTPTREGRHGDERWGGAPPVAVSSCPDVDSDGTPSVTFRTESKRVLYGNPTAD